MKKLANIIDKIQLQEITVSGFLSVFVAIVLVRVTEQQLLLGALMMPSVTEYFVLFVNMALAFGVMLLLIGALLAQICVVPVVRVLRVLLVGMVIVLLPPIIDVSLYGRDYWDYYEFAGLGDLWLAFITVFAQTPNLGVTTGMRWEIIITTIAVAVYAWMMISCKLHWGKLRKVSSWFLAVAGVYMILFVSGSAPSWIGIAVVGWERGFEAVSQADIAQIFLAPQQLLARQITDPLLALHGQMSIAYVLFLGTVVVWWYQRICLPTRQARANWQRYISSIVESTTGHLAIGAVVLGGLMALMLDTEISWRSVSMSTFALPAVLVALGAAALLVWSLKLIQVNAVRQWGIIGIICALIAAAVVSGPVLVMLSLVVAIEILRKQPLFGFAQFATLSYFGVAAQYLALFGMGAVLISSQISSIFSLSLLVLVATSVIGVSLAIEITNWRAIFVDDDIWIGKYISKQIAQFGIATWFSLILFGSIVVLNIDYGVVWIAAVIGSTWLWLSLKYPNQLGFALISGVAIYAALLLQYI